MGLFALEEISSDYEFGISHIMDNEFDSGYSRAPLGGFFNHSDNPNCEAYNDGRFIRLRTVRRISKDEELTVKYWLYQLK